ncbi:phage tail protein [Culicoidibacter larvae]|uniref:Tail spike domain-containing protein n=1 Tax=Culicoidibacter larvae TaxID=2579976 RepID=A0A5R8QDF9_9FIRM|nr:phage tail protein [Culicoidibacter larvae]TLG75244.1 hypothetical protein FEZ08_04150 [Culicoidibacter larvae]
MYSIFLRQKVNNSVETTLIHAPSTSFDAPKLASGTLKQKLSGIDEFHFSIYPNNPAWGQLHAMRSKIFVYDHLKEMYVFSGRVLKITQKMDNSGMFTQDIACESAFAYLSDAFCESVPTATTTSALLTDLLTKFNNEVDGERRLEKGVFANYTLANKLETNVEKYSTLVNKVREQLSSGEFVLRTDNQYRNYLDLVAMRGNDTNITIIPGVNLQDITIDYDAASVVNKIIPYGAEVSGKNINITSVNSNLNYLQDQSSIETYGVFEEVWIDTKYKDAKSLKEAAQQRLNDNKEPTISIKLGALDLSHLKKVEESFFIGDRIALVHKAFDISASLRIVEISTNIFAPHEPILTLANRRIDFLDVTAYITKQFNYMLKL